MSAPDPRVRCAPLRGGGRLLAALCALAGCTRDEPPPAELPPAPTAPAASFRPSILLVTLDTTRADALGCYGAPEWATPHLDALARRGVRFTSARAPAPVTAPAHATIFTGVYPFQHGVRDNGTFVLSDRAETLAERLKPAGYSTAGIPASFVVDSTFGLAQGFDRYYDLEQRDLRVGDESEARDAEEVAAIAIRHLAELPADARFLLWVHFFDPHFPYAPPEDLVAAHPFEPTAKGPGARMVQQQKHLYQLEVARVDRELGRILAALERFGGAERVFTLVVGDHGEGLGQHAEATHAALVYDSTMLVPLLIAHPTLPAGCVVETAVSTVDVTPTLLALLGLKAERCYGADLSPLWRGEPFAATRALYFENCATWFTSGWAPLYGVVEDRFKVIAGPQVRVFDVVADPGELHDLAAEQPGLIERARETLRAFADETLQAVRRDLSPDELDRLRALGYLATEASGRRGGPVPPGWQPEKALTPEQGLENTRRFTQANQLWRQGKREEGVALLLELTREEPENAHYAEIAAALLCQMGRPDRALPLARAATELAENFGSRSTLVACLMALGRRDEAFLEVQHTVERFPRLLPARVTLAELLIERGRAGEAIPHLEVFLREYAGDPPSRAQAEALLQRARDAAAAR